MTAVDPAEVWAWLVQIGQDRGGMYSYAGLVACFMAASRTASPTSSANTMRTSNPLTAHNAG